MRWHVHDVHSRVTHKCSNIKTALWVIKLTVGFLWVAIVCFTRNVEYTEVKCNTGKVGTKTVLKFNRNDQRPCPGFLYCVHVIYLSYILPVNEIDIWWFNDVLFYSLFKVERPVILHMVSLFSVIRIQ